MTGPPVLGYNRAVSLTVYQYSKCGTCRKALAWLDRNHIEVKRVDIVESPPSRAVLERAMAEVGLKKMFNTSGESYRRGNFKERLASMSETEALEALAADGKLCKRPLLVGPDVALVGFVEDQWRDALVRAR